MIGHKWRRHQVGFFALLLIVDWFLYFRHAGHFFQADTIFLLNHRAHSLAEYLKEFTGLHPSGWYRPLTNELVESILYPMAGLHPIPYRIPVYVVFAAVTGAVYVLALKLTQRHLAGALAGFFFNIHTVNAYTTYDLGFMPELLYAFFYICAALLFLRYLESADKGARRLSVACFIASLLSKEPALTLPATLFVMSLAFDSVAQNWGQRLLRGLRAIVPHIVVLAMYLAFVVGYLHVMGISPAKLLDRSQTPNPNDYIAVFNSGVLKNADLGLTWAFNIPRGWFGQWHQLGPMMVGYLKLFRVLLIALTVILLIRSERRVAVFGLAWFAITLLPALPLVTHFLPYYLFLPVVGLSVVVGSAFVWLYDSLCRVRPLIAAVAIVLVFGAMLYATDRSIRGNIRDNALLGGSSQLALNTLNDLKRFYPALPPDATLYFADAEKGLAWEHDFGGLIKMAYGIDSLSVLYQSEHHSMTPDTKNVLVFKLSNGRLLDETPHFGSDPANFMRFVDSDLKLELSASEVTAGSNKYTLSIHGLPNSIVRLAYTIDDGPLEIFSAHLDANGNVTFEALPRTRRGVYKFIAFSFSETDEWIRTDKKLTVR